MSNSRWKSSLVDDQEYLQKIRPAEFKLLDSPGLQYQTELFEGHPDVFSRRQMLEEHSDYKLKPFLEKSLRISDIEKNEKIELQNWANQNQNQNKPRSKNQTSLDNLVLISLLVNSISNKPGILSPSPPKKLQKVITVDAVETPIDFDKQLITKQGRDAMFFLMQDLQHYPMNYIPASYDQFQKKLVHLLSMEEHQIIIICGETGSGKTRLVPRQVARYFGYLGKVVVTQPLKLNTKMLSQNLKLTFNKPIKMIDSNNWDPTLFGWANKDDKLITKNQKIIYATDGWLLAKLLSDPKLLTDYNAIIIDEVHERTVQIDMLLLIIKKSLELIKSNPLDPLAIKMKQMKFILMTATPQIAELLTYFGEYNPAKIYIQHRTCHLTPKDFPLSPDEHTINGLVDKIITVLETEILPEIKQNLIYQAKCSIAPVYNTQTGTIKDFQATGILIFMPNARFISKIISSLIEKIKNEPDKNGPFHQLVIHELTAQTNDSDQKKAVLPLDNKDKNKIKLVVATNVAQTGITIPDLKYVIDSGLHYHVYYDNFRQRKIMALKYISGADVVQRAGRVGRIENGVNYKFFSDSEINSIPTQPMNDSDINEIFHYIIKLLHLQVGHDIRRTFPVFGDLLSKFNSREIENGVNFLKKEKLIDSNNIITHQLDCWSSMNLSSLVLAKCIFYSRTPDNQEIINKTTLANLMAILQSIDGRKPSSFIDKKYLSNNNNNSLGSFFTLLDFYQNQPNKLLSGKKQLLQNEEKNIYKNISQLDKIYNKRNVSCFIGEKLSTDQNENIIKLLANAHESSPKWLKYVKEHEDKDKGFGDVYRILGEGGQAFTFDYDKLDQPVSPNVGHLCLGLVEKINDFTNGGKKPVVNAYWIIPIPYHLMPASIKANYLSYDKSSSK